MLDNVPEVKKSCDEGKALFGTIDTWLIWVFYIFFLFFYFAVVFIYLFIYLFPILLILIY